MTPSIAICGGLAFLQGVGPHDGFGVAGAGPVLL